MSLHCLSRPLAQLQRHSIVCVPCSPLYNNTHTRSLVTSGPSGPLNDLKTSPSHVPTVDIERLSHLKRPNRGGQDLSQRYQRLERSLRGKSGYGREIQDLARSGEVADLVPYTSQEDRQKASTSTGKSTRRIFRGFVIPNAPKPPAEDECCMSGCAVCVYDLYDEARKDYIQALDNLRSNLDELNIPESEWPVDIRPDRQGGPVTKPNVTLSAFEQLEQALKAKKEQSQATSSSSTGDASGQGEG
ncbi:hypothetical protein C8Q74DRAFT_1318736 [Fomes fomentarius]|nr:hypothetical protein C8Q74DRAFT_1318736 [Fomes fomentarius]